jgi:gamma-glutamylcyclotransferase (GGCT)/AIG2-like uncharacterized protein YtfP
LKAATSSISPYLFVYGTLRRDSSHPMADFLARRGRWLTLAKTPGRLYDLGAYPGMLPAVADTDWVHGDLYELTDPESILVELDRYEGCIPEYPQPYVFARGLATVTAEDGRTYESWVYWYEAPVDEACRVLSGRYEPRRRGAEA